MARSKKAILQDLMDLGLTPGGANKAYAVYGVHASSYVRRDPYQLLLLYERPPWEEIERVAAKVGMPPSAPERIAGAIVYSLAAATSDGHVYLPQRELYQRAYRHLGFYDESALQNSMDELCGNRLVFLTGKEEDGASPAYLYPLYTAERTIAHLMTQLFVCSSRMALKAPSEKEMKQVEEEMRIRFAPAQREAISASLENKIVIITGGPGTGKTTIVRGVLHLWEQRGAKMLLAAPTGRAARRLAESSGRKASTIHRLLEYSQEAQQFNRNAERKLSVDLLVVDEVSMIETELMAAMLEALPPAAHLLLVGDVNQLPAVGPGLVLHDLIECKKFKTILLSEIFRQGESSLISFNAQKINQGQLPDLSGAGIEGGQDFYFVNRPNDLDAKSAILEMAVNRIPRQMGLNPKKDVQVLCPMIKKEVGVEKMNEALQECLNPAPLRVKTPFYSLAVGDKVMQTKNDYSKDVFNGDIGIVCDIHPKNLQAIIVFDGVEVRYDWLELENTALAYAITVHKSQGGEYRAVLIPLSMQHYPMLQRNLLYTAVSRGKEMVILVGSPRALEIAVRNNKIRKRYTGLKHWLEEAFRSVSAAKGT
ncbi:MAG: AAA family ATPase [Candidatus Omnitrophota bacterium]